MNRRELFSGFTGVANCPQDSATCITEQVLPNVKLRTHENAEVRFYDDMVKGKQVIINMMYATCEGFCPAITTRLAEVHRALSARMGRDLFIRSITLKPEEDDPAALKGFAEMHGALLPGWTFLTGDAYDIETLRFALFRHDHINFDLNINGHTGMMRVVNDASNRWVTVAPLASMRTVLDAISWADPPRTLQQRLQDNRKLQAEIDKEVAAFGYRKVI